jgi:hypothetical protein
VKLFVLEGSRKKRLVEAVRMTLMDAGATSRSFESAEAFRGALAEFASQRGVRDQIWKACVEVIKE